MTQKSALLLSAILTAFVLVIGGAVIARVSQADVPTAQAAAASATTTPQSTSVPTADVVAQAQTLLQQRDAQYRQLIDQANQRLATMNQQLAAAQAAQVAAAQAQRAAAQSAAAQSAAPAAAAQPAAPQIALSADAARDIAIQATNYATMIRTPELVRFNGIVAYEIGFTKGAVYVAANTGTVLYDGTQGHGGNRGSVNPAQPTNNPTPAPSSSGEHDDNHEVEHED